MTARVGSWIMLGVMGHGDTMLESGRPVGQGLSNGSVAVREEPKAGALPCDGDLEDVSLLTLKSRKLRSWQHQFKRGCHSMPALKVWLQRG